MPIGKNLYKNGKLTDEARAALRAQQEAASMPQKLKQTAKKQVTVQAPSKPTNVKSSQKPVKQPANAGNLRSKAEKPDDFEEDLCDTPPRNGKVKARSAALAANADANWVKIVEHNTMEGLIEERQMHEFQRKLEHQQKSALSRQLKEREAKKQADHEQKMKLQRQLKEQYETWEQEEKNKAVAQQVKIQQMKMERHEQIRLLEQRRQKELKRQALREKREQKEVIQAIQAEKEKNLKKRQDKIELMRQIRLDNEVERQKKLAAEQELVELTKRQMADYAKKLERQEQERADRLAATYAAQKKKAAALSKATEGARAAERAAELRAERERRQYEKIADQREKNKTKARRDFMDSVKSSVAQQLQERETLLKMQVEEDRAHGQKLAEETEKWRANEKKKAAEKRKVLELNAKFIQKQIHETERRKQEERAEMTDVERQLNSTLISNVKKGVPTTGLIFDPKNPYAWKNQRKTGQY